MRGALHAHSRPKLEKIAVVAGEESVSAMVSRNLARVRGTISETCRRSGRRADDVRLVCVTKYAAEDAIQALIGAGATDLGESHAQQLAKRAGVFGASGARFDAEDASGPPRWHMIGHVQRNKVNLLLDMAVTVHSVDSQRLAEKLGERAARAGRELEVFVEVNVAGEAAKTGVAADGAARLVEFVAGRRGLRLCGLMGMAPYDENSERARPYFTALRELLERLRGSGVAPPECMHLSMGMSGDYVVAIEEGATVVRVGSALFEGMPRIA